MAYIRLRGFYGQVTTVEWIPCERPDHCHIFLAVNITWLIAKYHRSSIIAGCEHGELKLQFSELEMSAFRTKCSIFTLE